MANPSSLTGQADRRTNLGLFVSGVLALLLAVPVAFLIHLASQLFPEQPERAVVAVGALLAALLVVPAAVYLAWWRRRADPAKLGLIVLATMGVLLVAIYLYWVSSSVLYPADVLIWSETEFVKDIIKLRTGYPLYTAQVNNESFIYTPGSQILTYLLASLSGNPTSIPAYRTIQLIYTLLAAGVAFVCCWQLTGLASVSGPGRYRGLWGAVWLPVSFLIATNSLVNPFAHNLHNDALALLVSAVAYLLLLTYARNRNKGVLVFMAFVPAIGFLVKQALAIWAVFYCFYLVVFDRPRSIRRVVLFALVAFAGIVAAVAGCYLLWGEPFRYWVFTVVGSLGVSPLRAFQHTMDVWVYFAIGLVGGAVLLRGRNMRPLLGLWLVWLGLIALETYTSGVAWMLNHIGPGSLISGVWFLPALAGLWPSGNQTTHGQHPGLRWLQAGIALVLVCLLYSGLGFVRIPLPSLPKDAYRYLQEIEKEFEGLPAREVLMDVGSWAYMEEGVVMKDQSICMGDRANGRIADFSGVLSRIETKYYSKILVRKLYDADFWYDHYYWPEPSGIRRALMENYHEVGRIRPVAGPIPNWVVPYGLSEIHILVPNPD